MRTLTIFVSVSMFSFFLLTDSIHIYLLGVFVFVGAHLWRDVSACSSALCLLLLNVSKTTVWRSRKKEMASIAMCGHGMNYGWNGCVFLWRTLIHDYLALSCHAWVALPVVWEAQSFLWLLSVALRHWLTVWMLCATMEWRLCPIGLLDLLYWWSVFNKLTRTSSGWLTSWK